MVRDLTTVMSSEWVEEGELSPEPLHIITPSMNIRCFIQGTLEEVLYNPTVGANNMSASYTLTHLKNSLVPTEKTLWNAPGSILEGVGIVHDVLVRHDDFEVALDFHIFDVYDFDILIGHSVEKLFLEAPLLGTIDFKLGRETFSLPISRVKNSPAELLPQPEPVEEVMAIFPFEPSESSLEQDARCWTLHLRRRRLWRNPWHSHWRTAITTINRAKTPFFCPSLCFLKRRHWISRHH